MNTLFYSRLSIVTLLICLILAAFYLFIPQAREHGGFSIASVVLFVSICIGLYYAGLSALQSRSKMAFTNLISVSVFGKMVVAIGFLYLYKLGFEPGNSWFVLIFLLCYVVYTVFEVWFMTKLARR